MFVFVVVVVLIHEVKVWNRTFFGNMKCFNVLRKALIKVTFQIEMMLFDSLLNLYLKIHVYHPI